MKRTRLAWTLLGLFAACAGQQEFDRHADYKSDILPVIQLGHSDVIQAVALSPDERFVASGSADGILKFWEVSSGRLIYTIYHHLNRQAVAARRGGDYGGIALSPQVTCVGISADGNLLVSGASDGNVIVTEIRTGAMIRVYQGHSKSVNAVSFSKDTNLAVTGDAGGGIHLWHITSGKPIRKFDIKFRSSQITTLDLAPDGRTILAGHGVKTSDGDYYFLGHNGTFDDPQIDGLNWRRLKECLGRTKGRATLFLDACHSGSIVNETVVPNDEMAHQFFTGERAGIMVFTASKGRQSAMESPDIGGGFGVFTWALTQGIGSKANEADINGNQVVEFMELVNFVERTVNELTQGAQTPWLSRKELFGDLPIATVESSGDEK